MCTIILSYQTTGVTSSRSSLCQAPERLAIDKLTPCKPLGCDQGIDPIRAIVKGVEWPCL